jgi:kinesin family protein 5
LIPRSIDKVFQTIQNSDIHIEFKIKVSIFEIYMEKLRDLLSPNKTNLKIRQSSGDGIYVENLTEIYVT